MHLFSRQFKAMGSLCEIKLYCKNQAQFDRAFSFSQVIVKRFEDKYTRFKRDSITSEINRAAGTRQAVEVDDETLMLLKYADTLHQQSDGLFDITSGILRKIWDFNSKALPGAFQKKMAVNRIGWDKVEIRGNTVRLREKQMGIDFGGFVKEYAVDVLANALLKQGDTNGIVNLGGDMRILGPHLDGKPWRVGIQHPRIRNAAISTVDVYRGAIATSGDYERFMEVEGRRYSHLLNPFTGDSIRPYYSSVSVILEQCLLAGSFSTLAMLKSVRDLNWIEKLSIDYLAVDQRMKITGPLSYRETPKRYYLSSAK